MKEGDAIVGKGILIKELSFKAICDKYDDHLLEYDIDDLWDAYKSRGAPWEIMKPSGKMSVIWPDDKHITTAGIINEDR